MCVVDLDLVQPNAPNSFGNQSSGNPSRYPLHCEDRVRYVRGWRDRAVWGRNGLTGLDGYDTPVSVNIVIPEQSRLPRSELFDGCGRRNKSSRGRIFICKDGLFD